ncbi:MAG: protein kinase [Planctomycetaceae bacterium]
MSRTVSDQADLPTAELKRIDAVCARFESAWDQDSPPDLSRFLATNETAAGAAPDRQEQIRLRLFRELLLADLEQRQRRGLTVGRQSYIGRFPELAEHVDAAFREFDVEHAAHRRSGFPSMAAAASGTEHLLPKMIGVYERGPCIGRGGMGVIYRGRDTRLGRDVAIKIMSRRCLDNRDLINRFQHEASSVARLSHPNIVVLHDIGCQEIAGVGVFPFAVMELLEGESLRSRLSKPVAVRDAISFSLQIADALAAAHQRGIIHRDIKPENVFLVSGTLVKVLDFGLAKTVSDVTAEPDTVDATAPAQLSTQQGRILGTYGYMAPEQIVGTPATAASDIFALTCVLFELLTGVAAFVGRTQTDIASATLRDDPLAVQNPRPHVAAVLDRLPDPLLELLEHGFRKDPARRLASATEFGRRLKELPDEWDTGRTARAALAAQSRSSSQWKKAGTMIAAVSVLVAAGYGVSRREEPGQTSPAVAAAPGSTATAHAAETETATVSSAAGVISPHSLAVLPFTTTGDDSSELFAQGITITLTNDLSQFPELEVRPYGSSAVLAESSDGSRLNHQDAARQLQVAKLVTGTLEFVGENIVIVIELIDAEKNSALWSHQIQTSRSKLLTIQSQLADQLAWQLSAGPRSALISSAGQAPTTSLDAYREYILGQVEWNQRTPAAVAAADDHFRRAVERDPHFAAAWAGIAQCCIVQAERDLAPRQEALEKAESAISEALAVDPACVDAIITRAMIAFEFRRDFAAAEQGFLSAQALMPNHVTGHQWYSELLSATGQHEPAIEQARLACRLAPQSAIASAVLGRNLFKAGRFGESIEQLRSTISRYPDFDRARGYLIEAFEETGDFDGALQQWQILARGDRITDILKESLRIRGAAGYWQARLDHAEELGRLHPVSTVFLAGIHAHLGGPEHLDAAFTILNDALVQQSPALTANLLVHPAFSGLRADPRFRQLEKAFER